ncbi:hypothetical protein GCM10009410_03900 [Shewanella ulleungensis]|uniref:ParE-like toxin domain-containing protein n=1 Tax=Shewanella ulleungensis TaxID=2282699 RepID=A0ABQ2QD82_9GAMM|nr:hypothetical protein GCM10009410_03900 [Shewanella ulleungensis]
MKQLTIIGFSPNHITDKAKSIIQHGIIGDNKRKIRILKHYYSVKLSRGYRLILSTNSSSFVCNHECYIKQIKRLKKVNG